MRIIQLIYDDNSLLSNLDQIYNDINNNKRIKNKSDCTLIKLHQLQLKALGIMSNLYINALLHAEKSYCVLSKAEVINALTIIQSRQKNVFNILRINNKARQILQSPKLFYYVPQPKQLALINPRPVSTTISTAVLQTLVSLCSFGLFDQAKLFCKKQKHPYDIAMRYNFNYAVQQYISHFKY